METVTSSLAKERHLRLADGYWDQRPIPKGLTAERTRESGIFDCLNDPLVTKDTSYSQFQTTNVAMGVKL